MADEKEKFTLRLLLTDEKGKVVSGLKICWGCNLLHLVIGWVLVFVAEPVGAIICGGIGLVQLAYVVPLCSRYKGTGETNVVKGLIIAASITALLNAGCWTMFTQLNFK